MAYLIKIIFIFLFLLSNSFASILFEKDDIIVTEFDIKIYQNSSSLQISGLNNNQLIKEIFLIKKTISLLKNNKPEFINAVDQLLNIHTISEENFIMDIKRYNFIKNDLIKDYYQNRLTLNDISLAIKNLGNYKLPLSLNNCITIDSIIDIKNIANFDELYFNNIKNSKQELFYITDSKKYKICLNQSIVSGLENELSKIISQITESDLKSFIYEK